MKCWSTKSGQKIFQVLTGRSNSFVLCNGDKYILIDTGRANKWISLEKSLNQLRIYENSLTALILTHTHFDHAENAFRIKQFYNTKLIVHKNEADYINTGTNPIIRGTNPINKYITEKFDIQILKYFKYKPAAYDITVEDKYDLSCLGFNAYILHTPGHSIGSISIIIDNEIAIVGDSMVGILKNSIFTPYAEKPEIMIHSWKDLIATGCSLFLPGHGSANTKALLQKQYDKYKNRYSYE